MKKITTVHVDQAAEARRSTHEDYVFAMSEGRRQRAITFRPKKGKGSYTRKRKHADD